MTTHRISLTDPRVLCVLVGLALAAFASNVSAHCQVPCGIYTDQLRFEQMLEDQTTIAKAIAQIHELAGKTDATSANQLARWIATKDEHATHTQNIIAQYFMTQQIKASDTEGYTKKLSAAHAVLVAAMKTKQGADADTAVALREAILDFYRAYEGKDPKKHLQG
ncbi:MAG: superoxide dismutase [Ni] [Acidobacteriota bacterium]